MPVDRSANKVHEVSLCAALLGLRGISHPFLATTVPLLVRTALATSDPQGSYDTPPYKALFPADAILGYVKSCAVCDSLRLPAAGTFAFGVASMLRPTELAERFEPRCCVQFCFGLALFALFPPVYPVLSGAVLVTW